MSSRRLLKVAEAIREVVSMAILTDLRDPRICDVTVTYVEVSGDLRHAKIHVSVMGNEAKQKLSLRGLQNAAGFLQQKVARRIETRYTPRLTFVLDQGVKHSLEVARLLSELLPAEQPTDDELRDEAAGDDEDPLSEGQGGEVSRTGTSWEEVPSDPAHDAGPSPAERSPQQDDVDK